jgi:hypothetical protein
MILPIAPYSKRQPNTLDTAHSLSSLNHLAIDFAHHDIDAAEDYHYVGDSVTET